MTDVATMQDWELFREMNEFYVKDTLTTSEVERLQLLRHELDRRRNIPLIQSSVKGVETS